jgi:hypothetical protein
MAFNPKDYERDSKPERRVVAPGKHRVTIQMVGYDQSKGTIEVTYETADRASIRGWYPVEGPRGFITANLLKAVGWPHAIEESSQVSRDEALLGQELEIVVAVETWQGKERSKVKYTNRLPGTSDRSASDQPAPAQADDDGDDIPF